MARLEVDEPRPTQKQPGERPTADARPDPERRPEERERPHTTDHPEVDHRPETDGQQETDGRPATHGRQETHGGQEVDGRQEVDGQQGDGQQGDGQQGDGEWRDARARQDDDGRPQVGGRTEGGAAHQKRAGSGRPEAPEWVVLGALVVLAGLIRFVCRHYVTSDMVVFYEWYDQLKAHGGIHGLKEPVGNYNAPFLYLLVLALYLPGATLLKIKAIFVLFDVLMVYFVYRLVGLKYAGWRVPMLAALVVAFLPTVVVNASMYGQCDSIWVAFSLGGVYYLLRDKQWLGVALIAVAIAFKPQGVFILPVLLLLVLARRTKARTLLALPLVYVALDLPAILLGRRPGELLTIYTQQLEDDDRLARSGPSVYHYLPVTVGTDVLRHLGYLFTIVLVLGVCYVLVATKTRLDATRVLTAGACFAILVPFLLPGMHERYFYLADVMTVVVAFYRPRLWYLPLIIQASSALAYAPFLFRGGPQGTFVDIKTLTTMMLAGILISGYALLHDVRSKQFERA